VSQSLLNKVWTFLVVVLLYLTLNVWSITQQWQLTLPGNPFKDAKATPFGAAFYGVLLCCPLFIVVCIIARLYASRTNEQTWENRFPKFGDFDLDTSRGEAKAFQAIAIFLFLLVPLGGVVHFQHKMLNASVFRKLDPCPPAGKSCCFADKPSISGWREMLLHRPKDPGAPGRLVYDPDPKNDVAPTFVPLLEPWGCLALSLVSVCFGALCIWTVFEPQRQSYRRIAGEARRKFVDKVYKQKNEGDQPSKDEQKG
jgi:hypothetical protein